MKKQHGLMKEDVFPYSYDVMMMYLDRIVTRSLYRLSLMKKEHRSMMEDVLPYPYDVMMTYCDS